MKHLIDAHLRRLNDCARLKRTCTAPGSLVLIPVTDLASGGYSPDTIGEIYYTLRRKSIDVTGNV